MTEISGKILGWRQWQVGLSGKLMPSGVGKGAWKPGVNTAECVYYPTEHKTPPAHDCGCGLYAFHDSSMLVPNVRFLTGEQSYITGLVACWGEVELHRLGFRSQYAEILCLVARVDEPVITRMIVDYIADYYNVPVLDGQRAFAYAQEKANLVPKELIEGIPKPEFNPAHLAASGAHTITANTIAAGTITATTPPGGAGPPYPPYGLSSGGVVYGPGRALFFTSSQQQSKTKSWPLRVFDDVTDAILDSPIAFAFGALIGILIVLLIVGLGGWLFGAGS